MEADNAYQISIAKQQEREQSLWKLLKHKLTKEELEEHNEALISLFGEIE